MPNSEVIAETLISPKKIEGTIEEVAQGVIDQILWPNIQAIAKSDPAEAANFCHDLIAGLTGCLVKVYKGDKAKSIAAFNEVKAGIDGLILVVDTMPAQQPKH